MDIRSLLFQITGGSSVHIKVRVKLIFIHSVYLSVVMVAHQRLKLKVRIQIAAQAKILFKIII